MATNDGGQAFPRQPKTLIVSSDARPDQIKNLVDGLERCHHEHSSGMSLRDYFAAQYLSGRAVREEGIDDYAEAAGDAYRMADAMLEERAK